MLFDGTADRKTLSVSALSASLVAHVVAVVLLVQQPRPVLIHQSVSLHGSGGRGRVIALRTAGIAAAVTGAQGEAKKNPLWPSSNPRRLRVAAPQAAAGKSLQPGMPGFILGSLTDGFAGDHDVRVAISILAPEPPIARSKLPRQISGDVVVEVTINEKGEVVQTKVLESVGFGLNEIIVETLHHWRYLPARVDGIPVASREDVHFHFPG